jgi:hypothetical protein
LALKILDGNVHVAGTLTANTFNAPANSIGNTAVQSGAGIEATKVVHQFPITYEQVAGTAVVAASTVVHIARATGTIVSFEGVIHGAIATGGDRTITIDLLKSTGAAAFASVLSSTLVLDNTNVLRTLEAASINTTSYIDGDLLQITVAVAGAAGNQGQGMTLTLTLRENPT